MEWALPALGAFLFLTQCLTILTAGYALHYAIKTQVDVKAIQNSTHQIQFVPADPPKFDQELNDMLDRGESEAYGRIEDINDFSQPIM